MLGQALAGATEAEPGEAVLYRIERPGVPTSFVFGTIHSEDPRVTRLSPRVREAFDTARYLVMEVLMDDARRAKASRTMIYTDGRNLAEVLEEDLYAEVVQAAAEKGLPEAAVRRCKPWGLVMMLSAPSGVTGQSLDLVLYNRALAQRKPVFGLERVEEQVEVFEGLPEDDQVALLRSTLARRPDLGELHGALVDAYLSRDLEQLARLNRRSMADLDPALVARIDQGMIVQRNAQMLERLLPFLDSGQGFIAMGALHLPGPEGVLEGLRERGYRVTALF
jgi:uncharacterized protein YbaP (TraB family)